MSIIIFILILSFLVIIHELGHYFVAKWRGVHVEEFGLGYPPVFKKIFTYDGTDFTLNFIPFGGFVRLEGENGEDNDLPTIESGGKKNIKESKKTTDKSSKSAFYQKSTGSRLAIIFAGPLVNFVFGIIAFSIIFSVIGIPTSLDGEPRIAQVIENSPASEASISDNVTVIGFSEEGSLYETDNIVDVQKYTITKRGQYVVMVTTGECFEDLCADETNEYNIYVRTAEETPDGEGAMGVIFSDMYFNFYPWYEMIVRGTIYGVTQAVEMSIMMVQALGTIVTDLVSGAGVSGSVAGPVGIVHHAQRSNLASEGWVAILGFAAMLSINLAIMNLLPIPALDGGRALFIILEAIFGKSRTGTIEKYANYGGFIFLIGLILVITANDIWRIFAGGI